jgi:predicted MFS family arabinose efflux permease
MQPSSAGSVALNTSVLYIGQSIGSTVGGILCSNAGIICRSAVWRWPSWSRASPYC